MNQKFKAMKNLLIILFLLIANQLSASIFTEKVYFDVDKDKVTANQLSKDVFEGTVFYLEGFADIDGDDEYNLSLSKRRVENVKKILIESGIDASKIHCAHFGESLNKDKTSIAEKKESRIVSIKYTKDPLAAHIVPEEKFIINTIRDTILIGSQGTKITITAGTFKEENVSIHLKEFYSPLAILSANLSTTSDGELLESAGMIHLEAIANGKSIQPQKELAIEFNANVGKNFKIWEGQMDSNLTMNWTNPIDGIGGDTVVSEIEEINYNNSYGWMIWYYPKTDFETQYMIYSNAMLNQIALGLKSDYNDIIDSTYVRFLVEENGVSQLDSIYFKRGKASEKEEIKQAIEDKLEGFIAYNVQNVDTFNFIFDTIPMNTNTIYNSFTNTNTNGNMVYYTSNIGYMNCDAYYSVKNKINFNVKVADNTTVKMIVKDRMAYFNSFVTAKNFYSFNGIPRDKEVYLVATNQIDDQIYLAIEETTTSEKVFSDFNFEPVTYDEMIAKIKKL